jgi:hypothetical protein
MDRDLWKARWRWARNIVFETMVKYTTVVLITIVVAVLIPSRQSDAIRIGKEEMILGQPSSAQSVSTLVAEGFWVASRDPDHMMEFAQRFDTASTCLRS